MASDEIIWSIIDKQFCAFKLRASRDKNFCRNEYNVTGLCNRQSCPLANSRYATVRADAKGVLHLYIKTIERAHMPSKLWQKIKLSANYAEALRQLDENLMYWPAHMIHRCKQRATRLTQVAIRMRRLEKEERRLGETLVPKMAPKIRRREETRERKAEAAAKLERTIERELMQRLKQGAYGDQPLNVSEHIWKKVLNAMEREGEGTRDKDLDEGIEEDEEELEREAELEDEADGGVEYVSDFDESEADLEDLEDWLGSEESAEEDSESDESDEEPAKKTQPSAGDKRKRASAPPTKQKPKKVVRRRPEIEHEHEHEVGARQLDF
ncbi:ribosomal L28e protein family-domain-containing protein [Xylariaceae sp. FL0804]|nr:ribosomal L28e protein family-domain-containing protein [Xylariaceae sp. FL0804]